MKDLARRLPVEPLGARSWERIEGGVFAALDRDDGAADAMRAELRSGRARRRLSQIGLIAATAVALVALFVSLRGWHTLETGTPTRVVTAESASELTLGDAALQIGPQSALLVNGDDQHGVLLLLERGSVECRVAPRGSRPPFAVQAGALRVEVVGTRFGVRRVKDSGTVEVTEGVVRVISHGETTLVRAGERWADATTAQPAAPPQNPAAPHDQAVEEPPAKPPALPPRRSVSPHRPAAAPARGQEAPPAAPQSTSKAAPSQQSRYEAAARLEASHPEAAVQIYRDLARGEGPWAANALFAHARLEFDRGNRPAATRLLGLYLSRFPNGANARDARALLDRH